jgi:hypothetical protein
MKRKTPIILGALVLVALGAAYLGRGWLRDTWEEWRQPTLPAATSFQQPVTSSKLQVPSNERAATNSLPIAGVQKPTSTTIAVDPLAWTGKLPDETNLAVPFTSQAPKQVWDMPYQEACEEAAMLMVDAFYRGRTAKFTPDEADAAILKLIAYENIHYEGKADMTAAEVATFVKDYYGYKKVIVRELTSLDQVKAALANGYPVMTPAYGKALGNPNFRNGGPLYHMLVIKGYLKDGRIITNDSGTRKGADYVYDPHVLFEALHDWNGGDVPHGKKMMIVVIPNSKP